MPGSGQARSVLLTNERPHLALIGCGGRGRGIAQEASGRGNVLAVCDVDAKHAAEASKQFKGAKVYKDFRKLLERKDVDAILNGTPDHWHTLVNLAALKGGRIHLRQGEKGVGTRCDQG